MPTRNARLRPIGWYRARKINSALANYPVYAPPHLRSEIDLSLTEARENFEYFMDKRSFRSQSLIDFMNRFKIEMTTNDSGLTSVSNWFDRYGGLLLPFTPRSTVTFDSFVAYDPSWTGEHIGMNVIWDIGIYLGECVIARNPSAHWALNTGDADQISREAVGYQRPCVAGLHRPARRDPMTRVFRDGESMSAGMRIGYPKVSVRQKLTEYVEIWSRVGRAAPPVEQRTY